jgi:lysophospholipase L1-like esterase
MFLGLVCLTSLAAASPRRRKPRKPVHVKPLPRTVAGVVNVQALDSFFEALQALASAQSDKVVRVMQFGDSHTAADFWTGRMRLRFQSRFGDGGPGLIMPARPWRGYHHEGVDVLDGRNWPGESLRGKYCDGWVGLAGAALDPPADQPLRLRAAFGEYRIHLLGPSGSTPLVTLATVAEPLIPTTAAPVPEAPLTLSPSEQVLGEGQFLGITGQSGLDARTIQELSVTFPEGSHLLGVDLRSGKPGVIYDELGLNGAELLDLARWNPELRKALLAEAQPDLLVLAYGTNDLGRTDLDPVEYEARARQLFAALKQESGAAILVVGPLDRIGRKRRQVAFLKAGAARVIHALRAAAVASDCAFWDARQAMGGEGSILKWRRAGLAQADQVHLTGSGYQRLGDQMVDALLAAYEQHGKTN